MNKAELVKAIQKESAYEVSQSMVEDFVTTFMNVVKNTVCDGDSVQLIGFGTFTSQQRQERNGINPNTKAAILIPAKKMPKFKPSETFTKMLND